MRPFDILLRNLIHEFAPDLTAERVHEYAERDNCYPARILNQILNGPFGTVDLAACGCKAAQGYALAYDQALEALENMAIGGDRSTVAAVLADREQIAKHLRHLRDSVLEASEPEPDTAPEPSFADMLRSMGFEVIELGR